MSLQPDEKNFLDPSTNEKATLATSRRSFIAGWKLCAGVALGLGLAGRNSSARAVCPTAVGCSCFLSGTRIKTPEGEINIEELRIGDNVLTASGEAKPIKFIGRRKVSRERTGPWKKGEGPVKISRFAIDGKAPHADLYISPTHAIYIDGILIPARNLVNGVTIVADAKPEALSLTLFHIELDTYEAIVAEGLAVESFRHDNPHAQASTMQTSMSDCTAHPGSFRHSLRRSSVIVVAAKNWHRICAAPLRPFTIYADRLRRSATALSTALPALPN